MKYLVVMDVLTADGDGILLQSYEIIPSRNLEELGEKLRERTPIVFGPGKTSIIVRQIIPE
ncbi:hypothetical protein L0Y69_00265 [bacterium]|nr:hypothetical protein [bacterium]